MRPLATSCGREVANRDSQSVITALIDQAHRLPEELIKSLTWVGPFRRFSCITGARRRRMRDRHRKVQLSEDPSCGGSCRPRSWQTMISPQILSLPGPLLDD